MPGRRTCRIRRLRRRHRRLIRRRMGAGMEAAAGQPGRWGCWWPGLGLCWRSFSASPRSSFSCHFRLDALLPMEYDMGSSRGGCAMKVMRALGVAVATAAMIGCGGGSSGSHDDQSAELLEILVTPVSPTIGMSQTANFAAVGFWTDGLLHDAGVTWESTNTAVATIT